jgi:hypothetical protein
MSESRLDSFFEGCADPRPTERLASLNGRLETSMNALADYAALELRKSARHLKTSTDLLAS